MVRRGVENMDTVRGVGRREGAEHDSKRGKTTATNKHKDPHPENRKGVGNNQVSIRK